jgi:hypothetical protein
MSKRVHTFLDDFAYEIIKKAVEEKGVSFSGFLSDSALDRALEYEVDRAKTILERYAGNLRSVLKQRGMEEAAYIAEVLALSHIDNLHETVKELQERDEKSRKERK